MITGMAKATMTLEFYNNDLSVFFDFLKSTKEEL